MAVSRCSDSNGSHSKAVRCGVRSARSREPSEHFWRTPAPAFPLTALPHVISVAESWSVAESSDNKFRRTRVTWNSTFRASCLSPPSLSLLLFTAFLRPLYHCSSLLPSLPPPPSLLALKHPTRHTTFVSPKHKLCKLS